MKINLFTLIFLILIFVSSVVLVVALTYHGGEDKCIRDPVEYANEYSNNYWWDEVVPLNLQFGN